MNSTIQKIQKLLSLSNSCNQAEAELAFQKAKALADKFGLDIEMAAIAGEKVEKEPFAKEKVGEYGRIPVIHKYLAHILQNHFKVRIVYNGWRGMRRINFVGRQNDIAVAKEVHDRLINVFDWLWKNYKKERGLSTHFKGSYMYGLYQGLNQKLHEQSQESIKERILELPEEIQSSTQEKLQLAIISEEKELFNALYEKYPHLRKGGRTNYNVRSNSTYSDGVKDGRNINTNKQFALT